MNTMPANMVSMNAMGGPVGAPMPMMNNGALAPRGSSGQVPLDNGRTLLNTYIYEYFMRYDMYDCARAILQADPAIKVKDGTARNDNGLGNNLGDEHMDTDSKDGQDQKRPHDLPAPNVPTPVPDSCFLYEWFCLFWDMFNSQKGKGSSGQVNQYVQHTQAQSRMRQEQQQNMLRQIRPEFAAQQQAQAQYQAQMMGRMQNGGMNMNMKPNPIQRAAMANNQNPGTQMHLLQQQQQKAAANQIQMQRDPSDMDGNRARPASPGSADNAPSPSKRQRLENGPFNPNQGVMMPNGRPAQGMPGQQQAFVSPNPNAAKSIATYAANLQQHHGSQMANKPMPNPGGPQAQGSPMNQQAPDGAVLGAFYNQPDMAPGNMRPGPGNGQGQSNGALQDYQMQLMLLEQQNKKRLMMARQEQDMSGGGMREGGPSGPGGPGGPGAPAGPNAQNFPGTSPPGGRSGASPNPSEQMKRGNQMNNPANMGSPLPDGAQSRSSPGAINFIDPNGGPTFFKTGGSVDGMNMMNAAQMNVNGMRPPSSHPAPFNGQMTPQQQQMMAARQQAQQQQAQAHAGPPTMQWPPGPGPNGQMANQGPQPQGTPQQRSMPPPSAPPGTANNANSRNATSSPQTSTAAPPTPQTGPKAAPKKKESKSAKSKAATQKKSNANLNTGATPVAEPEPQQETPTPATPITPVNAGNFAKNQALPAQVVANGQPPAPAQAPQPAPVPAQQHNDPQFNMDPAMDFQMDFANPLNSNDVLNDFDFDSFLHESNGEEGFDFNAGAFMEGGEIGAD